MRFFSDGARHLVCYPYSVANLHKMAIQFGIKECWFHQGGGGRLPHYDIPFQRLSEIAAKTEVVSQRVILAIIKGYAPPAPAITGRSRAT